jgi:hypothetical protein
MGRSLLLDCVDGIWRRVSFIFFYKRISSESASPTTDVSAEDVFLANHSREHRLLYAVQGDRYHEPFFIDEFNERGQCLCYSSATNTPIWKLLASLMPT